MLRAIWKLAWLIILLTASTTLVFSVMPELAEIREEIASIPFEEFQPFGLGGRGFLEAYDDAAERTWSSHNQLLASKPYDPGVFAWGIKYELRSYLDMYRFTEDLLWIDRAVARADHFFEFRDVNGDGVPSWGNYNETYGNSNYDYREYGVWDGVISTAVVETAQTVYNYSALRGNQTYRMKADRYLQLAKAIIDRYHKCWTEVSEQEGYYWDSPTSDLVGPIVNRFSALAIAEIKLYEILGDAKYLAKPAAMAAFFKKNLILEGEAYVWTYKLGDSSVEDISHGAIDLEFAILCYKHGLSFDQTDMKRFTDTYKKLIWRGFDAKPHLTARVDGSMGEDMDRISRNWVLLSSFDPAVWLFQWTVFHDLLLMQPTTSGGCFLQGLSQMVIHYPGEKKVTGVILDEAEKALEKLTFISSRFKHSAEKELEEAHSFYDSNKNVDAFKAALNAMAIVEVGVARYEIAMTVMMPLIVVSVILAIVQWISRGKSKPIDW